MKQGRVHITRPWQTGHSILQLDRMDQTAGHVQTFNSGDSLLFVPPLAKKGPVISFGLSLAPLCRACSKTHPPTRLLLGQAQPR